MIQPQTSSSLPLVVLCVLLGPSSFAFFAATVSVDPPGVSQVLLGAATAASVAALGATLLTFWRADPMGLATCLALVLILFGGLFWAVTEHFGAVEAAFFVPAFTAVGYVVWRHVGNATRADRVVGCDVIYDVRAVHVGWDATQPRECVRFRVQNIRNDFAKIRLRLELPGRRGHRGLRVERVQRLGPGDAGTIKVRFPALRAASTTCRVRVSVRHSSTFARRLILYPRRPFPVGPRWVVWMLGVAGGEPGLLFGVPTVQLLSKDAPGEATVKTAWVPDDAA
ncbi:MAG: hypothetical protein ACRBN8_02465 [Nannocystales bacterium]